MRMIRVATIKGCEVSWMNGIGGYVGQRGRWIFASEEDAEAFAAYAQREGAPSLANEDLEKAGIPRPIERYEE